ncbi:hypothetical protein DYB30_002650 [Aphanomyces astaci]|uniref:RPA43 OB domain-containing protein n=1 Tax=Aphanomyces astaci TaxID=112090 RepID=A0A397CCZ5_APHAT|nr:hypothetical protein DYB30_002650 [Aphanomyces astaci]RHY57623.1 hypothetical protein DYB38_000728 [Aphanomyces astaci]
MEAELDALQADLTRIKQAKAMALAQIEILLVEQKALQAKLDADRLQRQRVDELEARVQAAKVAATVVVPGVVVADKTESPPKVEEMLEEFIGGLVMSCSLAPYHIQDPKKGLEDQLNHMLMKYSEPVQGVLLAFNSLQVINPYGHIINETPYIHVRIAADALVFRPTPGMQLTATVNKVGSNHIGLLLAGVFNVSIAATEMPSGFVHNYHEDAWVGKDSSAIAVDDAVEFRVLQVHVAHGVISIDGSMRSLQPHAVAPDLPSLANVSKKATKTLKRKHVAFEDEVLEASEPTQKSKQAQADDDDDIVVVTKAKKAKKAAKSTIQPQRHIDQDDQAVVKKAKKSKQKSTLNE